MSEITLARFGQLPAVQVRAADGAQAAATAATIIASSTTAMPIAGCAAQIVAQPAMASTNPAAVTPSVGTGRPSSDGKASRINGATI